MSISIPKISNADKASSDTFNKPLSAIETHLNALDSAISQMNGKSSVVIHNVPIKDCFLGALVYFDRTLGVFRPALAIVDASNMTDGKYVASDMADVVGMLTNVSSSTVGDITISGICSSVDCVNSCLIEKIPGRYYLSNSENGKASLDHDDTVVQPVLTYLGGSDIILSITHQMPSQYQAPVLRGVYSNSNLITADVSDAGVVRLDTKSFVHTDTQIQDSAITSINGTNYVKTPVVTRVAGIGAIKTTRNSLGEYFIGTTSDLGGRIQASEYNLNGTKRSSDNIFTYIVFPAGTISAVTFSCDVTSEVQIDVTPWVDVNQAAPCKMAVETYFVPADISEEGVSLSAISPSYSTIDIPESELNTVKTYKSDTPCGVLKSGTVYVCLKADKPTTDIKILRAGVYIRPTISLIDYSTIGNTCSLIASAVAESTIRKDMVLCSNEEGLVFPASSDDPSYPVVGVSVVDADPGTLCTYTSSGCHITNFDLSFGSSYFVGHNGSIVSSPPEPPRYSQKIGEAIGPTTLKVDIEERIM